MGLILSMLLRRWRRRPGSEDLRESAAATVDADRSPGIRVIAAMVIALGWLWLLGCAGIASAGHTSYMDGMLLLVIGFIGLGIAWAIGWVLRGLIQATP